MTRAPGRAAVIDRLERAIVAYPPSKRRRLAIHVLVWSVIAMFANVVLYMTGVVDQAALILVTLVLSWLAITITAADLVATTDVREEATTDGTTARDRSTVR